MRNLGSLNWVVQSSFDNSELQIWVTANLWISEHFFYCDKFLFYDLKIILQLVSKSGISLNINKKVKSICLPSSINIFCRKHNFII